jgi:hypothetical protein
MGAVPVSIVAEPDKVSTAVRVLVTEASSLNEADWLAVAVGNGVTVAVEVIEMVKELLGEDVPLNVSPESVRLMVVVNVRESELETSSDRDGDCDCVAVGVDGGLIVLVVVGD